MMVKVKIFGFLRKYCHRGTAKEFECNLPEHSNVKDLLGLLGLPEKEDLILVINNVYAQKKEKPLKENDAVWIYPYLGGG